jgi:hypothetical protein
MKKIALMALLVLAGLSLASEVRTGTHGVTVSVSPDVPPPDCAPDCLR